MRKLWRCAWCWIAGLTQSRFDDVDDRRGIGERRTVGGVSSATAAPTARPMSRGTRAIQPGSPPTNVPRCCLEGDRSGRRWESQPGAYRRDSTVAGESVRLSHGHVRTRAVDKRLCRQRQFLSVCPRFHDAVHCRETVSLVGVPSLRDRSSAPITPSYSRPMMPRRCGRDGHRNGIRRSSRSCALSRIRWSNER
jgi:hypothetical protein